MNTDLLRPLTADHLETVRLWRNSPAVAQYMYTTDEITPEQQQAWFARVSQDATTQHWLIYYQERPVGLAYLYDLSARNRLSYWGFYLGEDGLAGRGLGAKVELAVLEHAFEDLKLNKLCCEVLTTNEKVIVMHEKFGFRREAFFRQHIARGNTFLDVVGLAMLRREWQQLRDSLRPRP